MPAKRHGERPQTMTPPDTERKAGKGDKMEKGEKPEKSDKLGKSDKLEKGDKSGTKTCCNDQGKPTEIPSPDKPPRSSTNAGVKKNKPASTRPDSVRNATIQSNRTRDPDLTAVLEASDITVLVAGDKDYERAVASSNLFYRFARPRYVVRPQSKEQVSLIVKEAVHRKIRITVKNGGHSYIGSSFPNDGIMLDLKEMNQVRVEKDDRIVIIEGGALWGHVYRALVDDDDGLMVNGGRCPSVGVSGFILGGGIGPFSRSYGMGVDNVEEISIVTADGELYVVRVDDNPDTDNGKLFWALTGAGGGNFGVVVEIKIGLHQLADRGKEIVAGRSTWFPNIERSRPRPDESTGLLFTMNHFYTHCWPDQMTIDTTWFSDLETQNGDLGVRFLTYFDGNHENFEKIIRKGTLNTQLSKQIMCRALSELSSRFLHESLSAQWEDDAKRSIPLNSTFRLYHSFCFTDEPTQITKITAVVKEELEAFKRLFAGEPAGLCQVSFIHAGGQTTQRESFDTAFRWRDTIFHTYIMVQWKDKWLERDMRGFAHKFKKRLKQFSILGGAAFVNFPDSSMPDGDHMEAYYGKNRDLLRHVKRIWDEKNFFKCDLGIDLAKKDTEEALSLAELDTGCYDVEMSDGKEEGPVLTTDLEATMSWESRHSTAFTPLLTAGLENLMLDYFPGDGGIV